MQLSLTCSPAMYQHFIQSHGLQIDRKAVFFDALNLITNPAIINCIIPVCLEELNRDIVPNSLHGKHIYSLSFSKVYPKADSKFILDTPRLEFLQSLVYKHRGKHEIDKPLIGKVITVYKCSNDLLKDMVINVAKYKRSIPEYLQAWLSLNEILA